MGIEGRRNLRSVEKQKHSYSTFEGTINIKEATKKRLEDFLAYLEARIAGSYLDPDARKEFEELKEQVEEELSKRTDS